MTKLAALTGRELINLLKRVGFYIVRQKGSHVFLKHDDGRATVIPVHSGETLAPGVISKILRDVEMNREELIKLLEE